MSSFLGTAFGAKDWAPEAAENSVLYQGTTLVGHNKT
jgi:hypothetical protein